MLFTWLKGTHQNGESLFSFTPDNTSMLVNQLNSVESCHLLNFVDEMREILHQEKIALPRIVVVGDQSISIQLNRTILHCMSLLRLFLRFNMNIFLAYSTASESPEYPRIIFISSCWFIT
jgi:hypothetical protein